MTKIELKFYYSGLRDLWWKLPSVPGQNTAATKSIAFIYETGGASQGGGQVSHPVCSVVYPLLKIHRANKNHPGCPVVIFNGLLPAVQYMVLSYIPSIDGSLHSVWLTRHIY